MQIDFDLITERYFVSELSFTGISQIKPYQLCKAVLAHDLIFGWFASWHSFLPVLFAKYFSKPSVVVIGGYDTANLPEIGYGSQRNGLRRLISRSVISNATHIITNSQAAKKESIINAGADPKKITVIYHGIVPLPIVKEIGREKIVLTVGGVWRENLLRKGLLPFVKAASLLPEIKFIVVGKWYDDSINDLRLVSGQNVEFTGFLADEKLDELYTRASVYVQASLHEGFGMSVAESMLAGCIPVVTRVGSLPEVVGNEGVYLESNSPEDIAKGVEHALELNKDVRQKIVERIKSKFPIEKRKKSLYKVINGAINNKAN